MCQNSIITPVLGLLWNKYEDELFCDVRGIDSPQGSVTRRIILSLAHRIFDPVGFTCPVTICPKLLLQESWQSKLSWDSEVPDNLKEKFLKWVHDMKALDQVKIPRKAFPCRDAVLQLHTFCDASGTSYAAAVFLRGQDAYETTVQLLMAKSRIAPLKEISIPRLELLACGIGVRLTGVVKKSLNLEQVKTYYWTDSTTALHWIKSNEPWGVFVQNRVKEIRKYSTGESWNHVPGLMNPADLPSRGCTVKKLLASKWWEGPAWLKLSEDKWPQLEISVDKEAVLSEKCKKAVTLIASSTEENVFFSYFSSYTKIIRMVAWIYRFLNNAKKSKESRKQGDLLTSEITEAEKKVIKFIQRETLTEEYVRSLKSLNIFKDEEGIHRVKTKLTERNDTVDFRCPIVLPGKHRMVELLISETHVKMLHAGIHTLLSSLRERYWIINGRKSVRSVV